METTTTWLWPIERGGHRRAEQNGRNRVAVGNLLRTFTQGSAGRATLGFGPESLGLLDNPVKYADRTIREPVRFEIPVNL